jgi:hypothetical protein
MTTVASGRPRGGHELVVVHDGPTLEVWSTATVHGKPSAMAPDPRKLTTIGHSNIVGAAAAPRPIGQNRPLLLADRSGLVSMWMTFGIRLNDPLPPDPNHRDVVAIAVAPGGGDDFTVVTASRADRNLRLWHPGHDTVALVDLDAAPLCLLYTGGVLVVGHEQGLIGLTV